MAIITKFTLQNILLIPQLPLDLMQDYDIYITKYSINTCLERTQVVDVGRIYITKYSINTYFLPL